LQQIPPTRDSPAIICHRPINYHENRNVETTRPEIVTFDVGRGGRARSPLRATFVGHRRAPSAHPTYSQSVSLASLRTRRSLIQNGDGTLIRKIVIIASAMMSLASMAPMFPSKLPHPARPASIIRLPAITSPTTAPITGPTNSPIRPKNNPTNAPRIAPTAPHLVAPKYFAPK